MLRNKTFLYVCLFGFITTILTLTLGIDRLRSYGNVRSADLSNRNNANNLGRILRQNRSQDEMQNELHTMGEVASNVQLKQIQPVNDINKANSQDNLLTDNTENAIQESQNKPMSQGLVDNKNEIQQTPSVNRVNAINAADDGPPIFVPDKSGVAIQESQKKPLVQSLPANVDNKIAIQQSPSVIVGNSVNNRDHELQNKPKVHGLAGNLDNSNAVQQILPVNAVNSFNKDEGPNNMPLDNTGIAIQDSQNKPLVQGLAESVDNRNTIQQSNANKTIDATVKPGSNVAQREHNFLDDFSAYPCINGLSVFPPDKWVTDGKCVRTVNYTECASKIIPNHQCVNVRNAKGTTMPICVYPAATDKWVSANIVKGNLWESDLVSKMTNYIKLEKQKQPDIEFLDLGSNIGCYSLYVAQEGIPVTAIDPLHSNMELISKSIILGKLQDRMKLIWNAVADHHNIVKFIPDTNNVGGTRITDIKPADNAAVMDVARAITFDDLLPLFRGKHIAMKIDIEESEYPALLGGEAFFQEVDVKVVQMEFMWHKKGKDGPKILEFFSRKGFQPFSTLQKSMPLHSIRMPEWPNDVYFMKSQHSNTNKTIDAPDNPSLKVARREHNFLDDFSTYPCINGLSVFPPDKWVTEGKCVRMVNYTECASKIIPNHECVNVRNAKGTTMPICVYPAATDKYVSANIVKGNLWEIDLVSKMTNYIKVEKQKQPDIEFLDLGSNIGCYSLYIAHEGIAVTAIDPLHSNMELISKSIILGKLQDKMKLIWNAVADHHNIIKFIPDTNNVGGTRITDIKPADNAAVMDVARAITFDDLLPLFRGKHIAMKVDVEESEYPALLGGEAFFLEVDIKVVQMEFQWHKKGKDGPKILELFSKRGFQPFSDLQKRIPLNSTKMLLWPNDVYFMKPSAS